jgi:hypothetical protein
MLCLITAMITLILTLFYDGTLSNHLIQIGVNQELVGYFFGLMALIYALSAPVVAIAARKFPAPYIT